MKGLLSRIEIIVAGVLLLIFIIWSASKCSETREEMSSDTSTEAVDSLANAEQNPADTDGSGAALSDALREKIAERAAADSAAAAANPGAATTAVASPDAEYTRLWVTIDKLKIRTSPGLGSEVLGELKLFDRVYFLDEVTDTTYQVNLGYETADEPYLKVKTKRGTVGWVYGAGVHYIKKKREGVLE